MRLHHWFDVLSFISFIFVSPVYTVKHILHLKYISTYTTAILKELWETVRIFKFLGYLQF